MAYKVGFECSGCATFRLFGHFDVFGTKFGLHHVEVHNTRTLLPYLRPGKLKTTVDN